MNPVRSPKAKIFAAALWGLLAATPAAALSAHQELARGVFEELVETDTTDATGSTTVAAEAVAKRLRGTGARRPLLLLAHLDVVAARAEDWSVDPFTLTEQEGFFYGRGTLDDKAMAAIFVANLIRYRQEGFVPDRDLVLALTADEELGDVPTNGVAWLLEHHRDLVDAELALNEGAANHSKDGVPFVNRIQTSEKIFVNFRWEVRGPGGHSSLPGPDNAIYHLAEGLTRLAAFAFPVRLGETTRAYFARTAELEGGPEAEDMRAVLREPPDPAAAARLSAKPAYNAQLRTTCVATRLDAGHADNALPQRAQALVNCRVLPGESVEEVGRVLAGVAGERIAVTRVGDYTPSPPSPLRPDLLAAVERLSAAFWPGTAVIPILSPGATDARFLRNAGIPTYGHSGLYVDRFDNRIHGKDERVGVRQFFDGLEYLYRLVKILSSPP